MYVDVLSVVIKWWDEGRVEGGGGGGGGEGEEGGKRGRERGGGGGGGDRGSVVINKSPGCHECAIQIISLPPP